MIRLDVDKQDVQEILKKIDPAKMEETMETLVRSLGARGKAIALVKLRPTNSSFSTDYAQKSMRHDARSMESKVYSVMAESRARSIETGRMPGETVPIKAVARWYTGNLYITNNTINNMTRQEKDTLYRIQRNIKRTGARGKHFIGDTWEKLRTELPNDLNRIAKKIEARWSG